MIDAVISVLTQYAVFDGRVSRAEYWWFTLAWTLVYLALVVLEDQIKPLSSWLSNGFALITLIPTLAVTVRRLDDIGMSGWRLIGDFAPFLLLGVWLALGLLLRAIGLPKIYALFRSWFLPVGSALIITGFIAMCWQMVLPSQPGANIYGPNPYEVTT